MKGNKVISSIGILAILGILVASVFMFNFALAQPSGGSVSSGTPERAPEDAAGSADAFAGNITELTVTGYTNTRSWQGYFGNVTGTIQLADSSDNQLYNWTLSAPEGQIYASTNSSITWPSIQCLNFTATGAESGTGGETAGGTSLAGLNLTGLEARFNIVSDDVDGVDETFGFGITHDEFYAGPLQFSAGECLATALYDSTGGSVDNNFEEVLLYEPASRSLVFAAILEESSVSGFDGGDHDFEMIVLEDGHGTDVSATTYYFFVELE